MKKILNVCLTIMMAIGLLACGSKPAEEAAPATLGGKLAAAFKEQAKSGKSAEEVALALSENELIEFAPVVMPVEEGYLNGFSEEIHGFAEGAVLAPMIGSMPFISYVFTLNDAKDADSFMNTLKEKGDLRWNICTEADEMVVTSSDKMVFFVMCPTSFEE